jgi:thiamine-monophosphate kinase
MPLPEIQLIDRIRRTARVPQVGPRTVPQVRARSLRANLGSVGIGDDCAVLNLPRGHQLLVTTDFSLESIHFRREWHPADSIGHRCLARGLSDIAAMGGIPRWAFLSLALPPDLPQAWVNKFVAGFLKLARQYDVELAGGDTAQSSQGVLADIMVAGTVPRGRAILRSGAKPGDYLYVTGNLGASIAVLQELRSGKKPELKKNLRHFYPDPRIAVGQFLSKNKLASAMIDTSDGLSTDLKHICEESRVGALVEAAALPRASGGDGLQLALHGGEDYELLFTVPPTRAGKLPAKIAGVSIARIGSITKDRAIKLRLPDGHTNPLKPEGWQHFS